MPIILEVSVALEEISGGQRACISVYITQLSMKDACALLLKFARKTSLYLSASTWIRGFSNNPRAYSISREMASELIILLLAHPATAVMWNELLVSAGADIVDKSPTVLPCCDEIAGITSQFPTRLSLFSTCHFMSRAYT